MNDTLFKDHPSDAQCDVTNPILWAHFSHHFYSVWKVQPLPPWTEAEVVQWMDTRHNKLNSDEIIASD